MKRFSMILGIALALCIIASANIIPTSTTITGPVSGLFTWTYDLRLSADQNVNSGTAPTINPVPHTNLTFAGFITIYDFAGYQAGSCAGPAGWTCTAQNLGFTPDDVSPTDNPNIVNITWAYTTGPTPPWSAKRTRLGPLLGKVALQHSQSSELCLSRYREHRTPDWVDRGQCRQHTGALGRAGADVRGLDR